ncbi:helix-turn-helix domain-containing protein [Actinomadura fibrosa]|uniref:Helix-turn-helix domain-containing protein n=1 Tax=Actinomadura fibrosa TaxID=111802 RepID=A0ABW2XX76_9ACTN|nr:AraC family transcriptional regulator [Actinomadura fibrosa]
MTRSSAPPGRVTPQRTRFSTTDPDEAYAFIGQMYAARARRSAEFDRTSSVAISQVSAGGISSVDFTLPPEATLHLAGTEDLSISEFLRGTKQAEWGRSLERYRAGEVALGSWPAGNYRVTCHRLRVAILTIPATALAQAAGALSGDDTAPLRFASLAPASAGAAEHWKRTSAFVRTVLDDDETAGSPLILGSARRLLARTALAVFPSTLPPGHDLNVRAATPATIRRAEDYIHAHAHTDVGLSEIAAACQVSPRALQYAFARHHQLSPMRYLRRIRLARVHRDLLETDPGSGTTVTAVAARWGFANHGRFSAAYHAIYGVLPSTTLHIR